MEAHTQSADSYTTPNNSISVANLLQGVEKSNKPGEFLLDESTAIDNPSVVAQQTAEALGVDIEIDETLPAKGSYNTRTGRIRINPNRHSSPQDIERTILHEVIGHGGLQALSKHRMPHTKEVLTKKTAQKIAQYNF